MSYQTIDLALDNCFDAVFAPERWPDAMDALVQVLGGLGGSFNRYGGSVNRKLLPASRRYRDMLDEFIGDGWQSQDLRAQRGWDKAIAGQRLVFEDECTSPEERARSQLYQQLFRRHDLDLMTAVSLPMHDGMWILNLTRSEKMGAYEPADIAPLLYAQPSLVRLLRFANGMSVAAAHGAMSAFAQTHVAALLLDGRGQVIEVNQAAAFVMGGALDISGGKLLARLPACNTALQALIHRALSGAQDCGAAYIKRPGRTPLIVEATRLRNARAEMFGFSGVTILITDPETKPKPRHDMLRQAFDLTVREAEVGHLLTQGCDIAEIAESLTLKRSSVQQIVKMLLAKTGAKRQSALVALFSRLPAPPNE